METAQELAGELNDKSIPKNDYPLRPPVYALFEVEVAEEEMANEQYVQPPYALTALKVKIVGSATYEGAEVLEPSGKRVGRSAKGTDFIRVGRPKVNGKIHPQFFEAVKNEAGEVQKDAEGNTLYTTEGSFRYHKEMQRWRDLTYAALAPDVEGSKEEHDTARAQIAGAAIAAAGGLAYALAGKRFIGKYSISDGKNKKGEVFSEALQEKPRNDVNTFIPATDKQLKRCKIVMHNTGTDQF